MLRCFMRSFRGLQNHIGVWGHFHFSRFVRFACIYVRRANPRRGPFVYLDGVHKFWWQLYTLSLEGLSQGNTDLSPKCNGSLPLDKCYIRNWRGNLKLEAEAWCFIQWQFKNRCKIFFRVDPKEEDKGQILDRKPDGRNLFDSIVQIREGIRRWVKYVTLEYSFLLPFFFALGRTVYM
jgi:hypothetical protein